MLASLDIAGGFRLEALSMDRLVSNSVESSKLDFNEGILDSVAWVA